MLGFADVLFYDKKRGLEITRQYRLIAEPPPPNTAINWATAEVVADTLSDEPEEDAEWTSVFEGWNTARKIAGLKKELADHLYRAAKLSLFENVSLGLLSTPGEDVDAFLRRCHEKAPLAAEQQIAKEKEPFQKKFEELSKKIPADPAPPPSSPPSASSFWDLPVLSWFKSPPPPTEPPKPIDPKVAKAKEELRQTQQEWEKRRAAIYAEWITNGNAYTEVLLKPRKTDVSLTHFGLVWVPFWRLTYSDDRVEMIPAYGRE
jgi:hypothetical protein